MRRRKMCGIAGIFAFFQALMPLLGWICVHTIVQAFGAFENSLFSGTVRDNLLMGNPDATDEQMAEALRIAAADFVFQLPGGMDSQCFEAGAGLSEGQAQRIAIARALLRPGSVLLLDEFSSALDAQTEIVLMERLTQYLPDHTMIFITHREKIIEYCDSLLNL